MSNANVTNALATPAAPAVSATIGTLGSSAVTQVSVSGELHHLGCVYEMDGTNKSWTHTLGKWPCLSTYSSKFPACTVERVDLSFTAFDANAWVRAAMVFDAACPVKETVLGYKQHAILMGNAMNLGSEMTKSFEFGDGMNGQAWPAPSSTTPAKFCLFCGGGSGVVVVHFYVRFGGPMNEVVSLN